jgi:hypothetical protein
MAMLAVSESRPANGPFEGIQESAALRGSAGKPVLTGGALCATIVTSPDGSLKPSL